MLAVPFYAMFDCNYTVTQPSLSVTQLLNSPATTDGISVHSGIDTTIPPLAMELEAQNAAS